MSKLRAQIVLASLAFCRGHPRHMTPSRLSTIVFGSGTKLPRLVDGTTEVMADIGERALDWLSANWPEDAVWPADVPRPDVISAQFASHSPATAREAPADQNPAAGASYSLQSQNDDAVSSNREDAA